MQPVRHLRAALATLVCTSLGLFSAANARTFGSSYTSSAPKDCRVSSASNGVDDSTRDFKCGKAEVKVVGAAGTAVGLVQRKSSQSDGATPARR